MGWSFTSSSTGGGGSSAGWTDIVGSQLFTDPGEHLGFPGFIVAPNGDLVMSYRRGEAHAGANGSVVVRRSTDGGATWTAEQTVASSASYDYRGGGLARLSDGRLAMTLGRQLTGQLDTPDGAEVTFSDDNGVTWSTPVLIDMPHTVMGFSQSRILELPGGDLIVPTWGRSNGASFTRSATVSRSTDGGATWSHLATIGDGPTDSLWYNEAEIVRVDGGRLVAIIRVHTSGDVRSWRRSVSDDNGASWTTPVTVENNCSGHPRPIRLPDGRLIAAWRRELETGHPGYVVTSDDGGVTWTQVQQLTPTTGNEYVYAQGDVVGDTLYLAWSWEHTAGSSSAADVYFGTADVGDPDAIPVGGGHGQMLAKASDLDHHVEWVDPADGTFAGLEDTPSSYSGQAGKVPVVNAGEDALEFADLPTVADETIFAPAYSVTDGTTLDLAVTFVWGIDANGDPYYNAAGVTAGDEAVLVLDNTTGEFSLRPVEV